MVTQPVNILMIEDNPGDAMLVEEYLADPGRGRYAVAHRDRLSGALAYLNESQCDLILLDLTLPDSSGLKTFAAIHDQVGDIPIVILTGHDDDLLAAQAIQDGAKDFIPKSSLDGALLARTIRHAMERRAWEERIHQSGMHVSRLEKFEAAGLLGAGIAHHFNNLLTTIIGNCELIADHPELDAAVRERNGMILKTAHRAAAVTRSLATFCRRQPAEPSLFRLDELVHGLAPLLEGGAAGSIALTIEADPNAGFISGDPSEVEQVVLNLAQNARDAMPDGGPLAIRTFPVVLPAPAEGAPDRVPAGAYAALVVADAGCGMAPEVVGRAFEPFFTT
jgi:signal transduction histidine kinase